MNQYFRKAEVAVDEQEGNACLYNVMLLRHPIVKGDIQRISTKYPFNIRGFPFPVLFIVFYPRLD